jgi:hypothetical protein
MVLELEVGLAALVLEPLVGVVCSLVVASGYEHAGCY